MPGINILIVDDFPEMLIVFRKILESDNANYFIEEAGNGLEALGKMKSFQPDIIITDWQMPEMNGIEFILEVRNIPDHKNTPIIVVTGLMAEADNLKQAFDAGASDFLRKPFNKIELVARIKSMLLISSSLKEIEESKRRELVASTMRLMQLNDLNTKLIDDIVKLQPYLNSHGRELAKEMVSKYKIHSVDSAWHDFETNFENVYDEFYKSLSVAHPSLTPNEKKICAFLRMGLSSKEIAALTFQDAKSIDMARYRLRKKLGLPQAENLTNYLNKF